MTPRCAEPKKYDPNPVAPEDQAKHDLLAPSLASLRAQEAHLTRPWDAARSQCECPEVPFQPAQTREIVTAVDDWFEIGALFGCFKCRDKN